MGPTGDVVTPQPQDVVIVARCAVDGRALAYACECLLILDDTSTVEFTCPKCQTVCVQPVDGTNLAALVALGMPTQRRRAS